MIDPQLLRDHPETVRAAMRDKRMGDPSRVDEAVEADRARRATLTSLQTLQEQLNEVSRQIGPLMKAGKRDEAAPLLEQSNRLKAEAKALETAAKAQEAAFRDAMLAIPNPPHPSVPVGGVEANETVATWGEPAAFGFEARPHWELAERHGLIDFERGAKVAGAGFPFYVGRGARLQRALIALFLDRAAAAGYTEVQPPLVFNEASGIGTGQLPDKEGQMYEIPADGLFLVPTSEVALVNLHRDEILDADALPIRYTAYTPCFRREAGSYGKDVRGLNRLHQFDKVEVVEFCHPDDSYDRLDAMRAVAEGAVEALGLHYRTVVLATGDMGMTQTKTFDLEVWSPGQERWLEVSSISNIEAYQARRAGLRVRPEGGGKPVPVHTLNASALALPRVVAALLETGQQADGSVRLPDALAAYAGFDVISA